MAQLTNSTLRDQINRLRSQPEDLFNGLLDRTVIEEALEQEGCSVSIEKARQMASHSSPKTTKLYDRTNNQVTLDEVEKIVI